MLSSISWQQYFAAIAVIGISYYLYVVLRYYQREISGLFHSKQKAFPVSKTGTVTALSIMGQARQDQNISVLDEQDISFAPVQTDEYSDESQLSSVSDAHYDIESVQGQLASEVDSLIEAYADLDQKEEFLSLLSILINSYQEQTAGLQMRALVSHILKRSSGLPFTVVADDLPIQFD